MIRVLLGGDHATVREGLHALLAREPDMQVVAEALRPDVLLMDLAMPPMDGLETARRLKARWPGIAVIILTVHDEGAYRRTALAAGAEAFLEKKTLGVDLWPTLLRITKREPDQPT
jgi:DNA-binding NarL/FixJ family response regulator